MDDPRYLARCALARLPRPYTDEVILHVFCEIERTPHLRKAYTKLKDGTVADYTSGGLNSQIAQGVARTLNAEAGERMNVEDMCEIVGSVSLLDGIESNWSWDDDY